MFKGTTKAISKGSQLATVSCIIRFHDLTQLNYLERAVQSLHSQTSISVCPIIVTQRFSESDIKEVEAMLEDNWYFEEHCIPRVLNVAEPEQGDIRSLLINTGIQEHNKLNNRFLCFLDYDDILYSHAFSFLSDNLINTSSAIAFATVEVADAVPLYDYDFIYRLSMPYKGKGRVDLLKDNFCPIHSYLLDTSKIPSSELFFRENMTRLEDYEFLLRVVAKYPSDFSGLGTKIGLYYMRSDGSNSTCSSAGDDIVEQEKAREWDRNRQLLSKYRSQIEVKMYVSDF